MITNNLRRFISTFLVTLTITLLNGQILAGLNYYYRNVTSFKNTVV